MRSREAGFLCVARWWYVDVQKGGKLSGGGNVVVSSCAEDGEPLGGDEYVCEPSITPALEKRQSRGVYVCYCIVCLFHAIKGAFGIWSLVWFFKLWF